MNDLAKAIPVPQNILDNPRGLAQSIGTFNLSSRDVAIVVGVPKDINVRGVVPNRWDTFEIDGWNLPKGHFASEYCPPYGLHVSISVYQITETGKEKKLSADTWVYASLRGKLITINEDPTRPGMISAITTDLPAGHRVFGGVSNTTDHRVHCAITRSFKYDETPEGLYAEKVSRAMDLGRTVVEERDICPQSTFFFKLLPARFIVRVISPVAAGGDTNNPKQYSHFQSPVDSVNNYNELGVAPMLRGNILVIFNATSVGNKLQLGVYNVGEIKLISDEIAITGQSLTAPGY